MDHNGTHPSRIGRYVVVEIIGHGAMSDVYAGLDETIGRRVAIRLGSADDPRVHHQARLTGQVAHPNVVSVLDLGEHEGRPFAVTELLGGLPLDREMTIQTLDRRLDVMHQICDGLQAAHDRGVVHGFMKPSHVFVQPDGVVKLIDFGGEWRRDAYAAPEQLRGSSTTERADVFSAAATFQFLLTRRPPYASAEAVIADQPPAISDQQAPEPLSRTLLKAMHKDPQRRHTSINLLRSEIEQVRQGRQGTRQRVLMAAFDRYRDIEALLAQRRALGRRIGLKAVEQECDAMLAELAAAFPDFVRAGLDLALAGDIAETRAAEALAQLQIRHNDLDAEVAVLKTASGAGR